MKHLLSRANWQGAISSRMLSSDYAPVDKWWDRARCKDQDPNLWFPEWPKPNEYKEARAICQRCPVITQCLADAMVREQHELRYGMFGGKTPGERRHLARKARVS